MTITNEIENEKILERIQSLVNRDDLSDYEVEELNELVNSVFAYEEKVYSMDGE